MLTLATYLNNAGRNQDAEPWSRKACETATVIFGKDDVRTAKCWSDLSWTLHWQERWREATTLAKKAAEIYQAQLGPDDFQTKEARLHWLSIRGRAGEKQTPEQNKEFHRLFKEVYGEPPSDL